MTSALYSSLSMSLLTRSLDVSVTSLSVTFFILPLFCYCCLQIWKMLLIELMICPISLEFLFFLLISFSKSCSREEFFSDIFSSSSWRLCILLCYSQRVFCNSLSLVASICLANSISLLICCFLFINFSFSVLRFLNLFCSASISSNSLVSVAPLAPPPPCCPLLSCTILSRKSLNFWSYFCSSCLRLRLSLVS